MSDAMSQAARDARDGRYAAFVDGHDWLLDRVKALDEQITKLQAERRVLEGLRWEIRGVLRDLDRWNGENAL